MRDLIAATVLVKLLKLDLNLQYFGPGDFEIWLMTPKNNRTLLLYYIVDSLSHVTLKFDGWAWKIIGHLFYAISSFVHHFIVISEIKLELQFGNAQFGSKSEIFFLPRDLEIWWMILKKNSRTPLRCYFKLCAAFRSHLWIQTGVMVRKSSNWDKICFDLYYLKLWPLALTLCMDIAFVNDNNSWEFQDDMMRGTLWKRCNGRTADSRTDGQTDRSVLRAAWSWLKISIWHPPTFHPGTWRFHLPRANRPRPLPLSVRQIKQYFPTSGMKLFPTCGKDR